MRLEFLFVRGGVDPHTVTFYSKALSETFLHSVRDEYTKSKLQAIGINNVINTSCPTMWKLTEDFCQSIPTVKANSVMTTITDYAPNREIDAFMLNTLLKTYKHVYLWLQGENDLEYFNSLDVKKEEIILIPSRLSSFDAVLGALDLDYIGTRLHAGIHALNCKKRTMIIGVDNRAIEISKDTGLPVLRRELLVENIENAIIRNRPTQISLPMEAINTWRNQFDAS